jgi:hypothetical protein
MLVAETREDTVMLFPTGRMSEQEFDAERARLRGLYGPNRKEAGARFEQALAKLYLQSGWTPLEIAAREGKGMSKGHVSRLQTFARFLVFLEKFPTGNFPENRPLGLTERRFREFWAQTDSSEKNWHIRYKETLNLLQDVPTTPKPKRSTELGKTIAATIADGKWRAIEAIAKQAGWPVDDVRPILDHMVSQGSYGCTGAKKPFAKTFQYRIFPQDRQVSTVELTEELAEPLARLTEQGRANMATMSPPTVAFWTAKIAELVNKWAGRPPKGKAGKVKFI